MTVIGGGETRGGDPQHLKKKGNHFELAQCVM